MQPEMQCDMLHHQIPIVRLLEHIKFFSHSSSSRQSRLFYVAILNGLKGMPNPFIDTSQA
jgi:hypothetical protein